MNNLKYKAVEEVKYKELVESLINEVLSAKENFKLDFGKYSSGFDEDFRWRMFLEGLFIEQLDVLTRKVSAGEFPEEAIGDYVMEFFVVWKDDRMFDIL